MWLNHWRNKFSRKFKPLAPAFGTATPDIVVAHCEVNSRQGVGILLKRLFPGNQDIFSLRSRDLYGGDQDFGFANVCLGHPDEIPAAVRSRVAKALSSCEAKRILSVPYFTDDVLSSIALKDLRGVPLCTYLMDDQNIFADGIADHHMRELLEKSDLRLGISRELCEAYEQKYGLKFWFLPPVVDAALIQTQPAFPLQNMWANAPPPAGVLIGNIWSQQWLDRLRSLTRQTGLKIDWHGNPNRSWLDFKESELEKDGIAFKGFSPERDLLKKLRRSAYAVILTGTGEETQDRPELAKLSLPSRITYLVATANVPLIVVGSRDTAAARFVETMALGIACDYTPESFGQAVAEICSPPAQERFRKRAACLAPSFSADNMAVWIWRSLERGQPINYRFEQLGKVLPNASAVVTAFEINQLHGTGPLVDRIVTGTPEVLSIHSMDLYDGEHYFGDLSHFITHDGLSRAQSVEKVITAVGNNHIKQILCVPYRSDDLITSITLAERFEAPLGTYIMDDQNVYDKVIPDALMHEFLSKCSIRFATHPELREAYENKYGLEFYILPAVVPHHLLCEGPQAAEIDGRNSRSGVLIGSLWSRQWFDMLSAAACGAGLKLDWYGNTKYPWMEIETGQDVQQGIVAHGLISEPELVEKMRCAAFVVVPTGTLDAKDDRKDLSLLSLPGRIIFAMATSTTPVIILGSRETAASHFVARFGVGITCDYDASSLREAVDYVTAPQTQWQMRKCAAEVASQFAVDQMHQWLWESVRLGRPMDMRFEELFPRDVR